VSWLLLTLACRTTTTDAPTLPATSDGSTITDSVGASLSGDSATSTVFLTAHTGGTSPPTGDTASVTLPHPPTTTIARAADDDFASDYQAIAIEGAPDVLLVATKGYEEQGYGGMFLQGPFPAGDLDFDDLWDGVSGWGVVLDNLQHRVHPFPDQNGDGVEDYWLGHRLVPGPLLGQLHGAVGDSLAHIEMINESLSHGAVFHAGFDYDGDSELDILVGTGGGFSYHVYHGPFDGEIPYARTHPNLDHYTEVGWGSTGFEQGVTAFPDFIEPSVDAVVYGCIDFWNLKSPDLVGFALRGERGRRKIRELFWGDTDGHHCPFPLHDITGNGYNDLLFSNANDSSVILEGPFDEHEFQPAQAVNPVVDIRHGVVTRTIPDMNGDGAYELLAENDDGDYLVLLSPHPDPIDVRAGLVLEEAVGGTAMHMERLQFADLDDDGVNELIGNRATTGYSIGKIIIYDGADLVEAWNTLHGL
jgi:hypothetical protein